MNAPAPPWISFQSRSIAILGASPSPGKLGRLVLENLVAQGYPGEIYPINPNFSEILGRKCFARISEVPNAADLAVILIPARDVEKAVLECIDSGILHFVIMSAGFKEAGDAAGKQREERLSKIAIRTGARIVGPNCLGIYDNISRVDTFFLPRNLIQRPEKGVVSLASQSGSFVGHFLDLACAERLGIARAITYGNRVDVSEADALDFFSRDASTQVIGLYVEGVSNGGKFLDSLRSRDQE